MDKDVFCDPPWEHNSQNLATLVSYTIIRPHPLPVLGLMGCASIPPDGPVRWVGRVWWDNHFVHTSDGHGSRDEAQRAVIEYMRRIADGSIPHPRQRDIDQDESRELLIARRLREGLPGTYMGPSSPTAAPAVSQGYPGIVVTTPKGPP